MRRNVLSFFFNIIFLAHTFSQINGQIDFAIRELEAVNCTFKTMWDYISNAQRDELCSPVYTTQLIKVINTFLQSVIEHESKLYTAISQSQAYFDKTLLYKSGFPVLHALHIVLTYKA